MVIKIAIDDYILVSSGSDSLSERTANWFGDRKEAVDWLGVVVRLRFLFSR